MSISNALIECMREQNLRDEQIAVLIGVSAQTVMKWRTGVNQPRFAPYNALRQKLKGFAERIDSVAA